MDKLKTCKDIAKWLDCSWLGEGDVEIHSLNSFHLAGKGDLTFAREKKFLDHLSNCNAAAIIVPIDFNEPESNKSYILSNNPYESFLRLVYLINDSKELINGEIHKSAIIAVDAQIDPSSYIGPNVVIQKGCKIGKNNVINANVVIYDNTIIGDNNLIHSNVTIYQDTQIGNNCIFHANCVIGSDGFGYLEQKDGSYKKIPQIGNVLIENDVEIGANTTIDRAFVGSTIIRNGVKMDNLVQIAHNCQIGENTAIVAQVGIAGSTIIGKRNRFAGQVGIAGHIDIADDVVLLAKSGVHTSIKQKGEYFGIPARPKDEAFRILFALGKLPEMMKKMNKKIKESI
ncbi:MAG: UDP-3-O-(3-hydroxymyristoyl)glucosamine N-acyltransferase [bacterium]